jgi:hypothetical protein
MPTKMARSASRPPIALPEMTVALRTSRLPCKRPRKSRISKPVRESSGESRLKPHQFPFRLSGSSVTLATLSRIRHRVSGLFAGIGKPVRDALPGPHRTNLPLWYVIVTC